MRFRDNVREWCRDHEAAIDTSDGLSLRIEAPRGMHFACRGHEIVISGAEQRFGAWMWEHAWRELSRTTLESCTADGCPSWDEAADECEWWSDGATTKDGAA